MDHGLSHPPRSGVEKLFQSFPSSLRTRGLDPEVAVGQVCHGCTAEGKCSGRDCPAALSLVINSSFSFLNTKSKFT